MKRESGTVFRQSLNDFPCPVVLGKDVPSFGLHRFKNGLRFVPSDNEGFSLRGDKRRLVYKGRQRSHRFTILGDTAFEYDCILEREPETNVISLLIEGEENFNFFRQPDFIKNPLLAGSYAVYKKETLLGEGTGKLCHIHRPEIIDARGRRCWGDLAVVGNEMRITIAEKWLSEAKYPVVVDPTIGTTTIGSQYLWDNDPLDPDDEPLMFEVVIPVNRYLVPETIQGNCTAYFYTNDDDGSAGGRPVIYSDSSNHPLTRKSTSENFIDLRVAGNKPKGWRSGTFVCNQNIVGGTYIWFGLFCEYVWFPRFDYGSKCYSACWDDYDDIPDEYPLYDAEWFEDFKLSMYFDYPPAAQNYMRTLTQGVTLNDTRRLTGYYKRSVTQSAGVNSIIGRWKLFLSNLHEIVTGVDNNYTLVHFLRSLREMIKINVIIGNFRGFYRSLFDNLLTNGEARAGHIQFTKISDVVHAAGTVFKGLILFVRIVTGVYIRDYLLRRFLKSKSELVLKSCVVREIVLDSKVN